MKERVAALDAFRGFTMVMMVSEGFGITRLTHYDWLAPIAHQFDHASWDGVRFWDMIQPFFMFIVGAVMPWSFEKRWHRGEAWSATLRHVLKRAALLLLWGLIARSIRAGRPLIDVINVLGQLAFTYPVAFLTLRLGMRWQLLTGLALLAAHTALYIGYGNPWMQEGNIGWDLDRAIFHKNWGGHYTTINCLSSAFNTILGVVAGTLIRKAQFKQLAGLGAACFAAGLAISTWVPLIKKIWTASFALLSGGLTIFALLLFWFLVEERGWKFKLFAVVGANSIFIYLFHEILEDWLQRTAKVFTGWGTVYWPPELLAFNDLVVVAFQFWVCFWLYRRQIFFKL